MQMPSTPHRWNSRQRATVCGNGNWCGRCRGDIREEAFQWLRDLAQWDAPRNETLLEFRRWERHILHDRARGTDHDPDPESA